MITQDERDGLVVVEYLQDADSFGWSIAALLHAYHRTVRNARAHELKFNRAEARPVDPAEGRKP